MSLTPRERKTLLAASHALRPVMSVAPGRLNDATIEHLRHCFAKAELVKLRVLADDGPTCDALAAELVDHVPCELVRRVGRVLILYRPAPAPG